MNVLKLSTKMRYKQGEKAEALKKHRVLKRYNIKQFAVKNCKLEATRPNSSRNSKKWNFINFALKTYHALLLLQSLFLFHIYIFGELICDDLVGDWDDLIDFYGNLEQKNLYKDERCNI